MILRMTALLAALVVAACTTGGGVQVYNERYQRGYSLNKVGFYAQDGGFQVAFLNTPSGTPAETFKTAFTNAMVGHNHGPRISFTPAADLGNLPGGYAVVLFAPGNIVPDSLCFESPTQARPQAPSGSEALLIYCDNGRLVTTVRARGAISDPGSAGFDAAVGIVTRTFLGNPTELQGGNPGGGAGA